MGGISGRRPRQTFIDGLELVKQKNLDNRLERNLTPVNLSVGQPTSIFSRLFNYVYHLGLFLRLVLGMWFRLVGWFR